MASSQYIFKKSSICFESSSNERLMHFMRKLIYCSKHYWVKFDWMIKAVLSQGRVNEQSIFESNSINKSVFELKFIEFSNNFWVKFDWIHFWAKIDWLLKEFCIRLDWMIENFLIGMWLLDQSTLDWNSIRRKSSIDKSVFESNSIERTKHFWAKICWKFKVFLSQVQMND